MYTRIVVGRTSAGFILLAMALGLSSCSKGPKEPSKIATAQDWVEATSAIYTKTMKMAEEYVDSGSVDLKEAEEFYGYVQAVQEASSSIYGDNMQAFLQGRDTDNKIVSVVGKKLAIDIRSLLQGCSGFVKVYFIQKKNHPTVMSSRKELVGKKIVDLTVRHGSLETNWQDLEGLK